MKGRRPSPPTIAAAILAGGRATRYGGVAKGLLQLPNGESIIARLVRIIGSAGVTEIVICADDPSTPLGTSPAPYEHLGLPIIPDHAGFTKPAPIGPLGGIAAALRHFGGRADGVLILPCDMPAITEREIRALMEAFGGPRPTSPEAPTSSVIAPSPRGERGKGVRLGVGGRSPAPLVVAVTEAEMQPLCAVLRPSLLDEVLDAVGRGELAVGRLWRKLGAELVRFPGSKPFANVNTPEDFAAWIEANRG